MRMTWDIEIGETLENRKAVQARVGGGSMQNGITRVAASDQMLVFTGAGGSRHGYSKHEGLTSEQVFRYSGEGQNGDQTLTRNNRFLAESDQSGRPVRVFLARGTVTYVGEFVLDRDPYSWERFRDTESNAERTGLVFNLLPVQADTALLDVVEAPGASSEVVTSEGTRNQSVRSWSPLDFSSYLSGRTASGEATSAVSRLEFELQTAFGNWLTVKGDAIKWLRLTEGGVTISPDLYDATSGEVVEAKKSTARAYVRTAIGQVLDYAAVATRAGLVVTPSILVPSRLSPELLDLCGSVGISVWSRTPSGFEKFTPRTAA